MTGAEHYRKAEEYLEMARGSLNREYDGYVARAQVHAILALAEGTHHPAEGEAVRPTPSNMILFAVAWLIGIIAVIAVLYALIA